MKETEALAHIKKHTGIELEKVKIMEIYKKNSYFLDAAGNLIALNLNENKLEKIDFLVELKNLHILYFKDNQVSDLSPLKELKNLLSLSFDKNQVSDLSPVKELGNLTGLDLSNNQISDISPVKELGNLTELSLHNNQITDISPVKELGNLTVLYLDNNQITDISPVKELGNLTKLSLSNNQISDISAVKELGNLTILRLSNNQITDISPVKELGNLTNLHLDNNQISDISPVKELGNLTTLFLSNNQITDISPVKELGNLTILFLFNNQISDISPVKELKSLGSLICSNNPIKGIPSECLVDNEKKVLGIKFGKSDIQKIREYYQEVEKQSQYIFEAKMVLVGEPAAGKTSLSKKIRNLNYELKKGTQSEEMTRGIEVSQWSFPYANPKQTPVHKGFNGHFTAHIFDFGGQDIMHATHRYFLSRRTLYVLVADTRPEDTDFYYWLNIIELFGDHSPVIIVMNDKHKVHKDVPKHIVEQFAHLIENRIFHVNLQTNKGLTDLLNCIQSELQSLPHVGTERHPRTWIDIRKELDTKWVDTVWDKIQIWKNTKDKKHYISRQEYLDIAENIGVANEEKALQIAETLHTLGAILYFQDNDALVDTIILNKHWATEAVYLVLLDKEVAQNHGKFAPVDYRRIWKDKYPTEKHHALLALMLAFKIAYQVQQSDIYIAPQLLPENPSKEYDSFWEKEAVFTHFEYRYPKFMPKGLLSRLIIELNQKIRLPFQWRYGVILEIQDCFVEVNEHRYGSVQKITVRTQGKEPLKAMAVVFDKMAEIHGEYPNLVFEEMIPCNCSECKTEPYFFAYNLLQKAQEKGKTEIECQKSFDKTNILVLLEGYRSFDRRRKHELGELQDHIDNLEMSDFFDKFGDIIEEKDKTLFETARKRFISGKTDFDYLETLKVLVGKYK